MFWNKQSKKKCAQNRTKEFFFNLLSFLYIFVYCKMFWSEAKILKKKPLGNKYLQKLEAQLLPVWKNSSSFQMLFIDFSLIFF